MSCDIQVGFGRTDIMPVGCVELGGMGNGPHRISNNIRDTLYATCLAITDCQGETLLLITMDLLHAMEGMVADMREIITRETGIPGDHIMIACTHTHAGPDIFNPGPQTVNDYIDHCVAKLPQAAYAALADRKPARIFTAMKEVEGMNFVRHYWREDGTCGVPTQANPAVSHTTEADHRMRLLQIKREGGKDILVMNWQAHPCFTGTYTGKDISADYIASVRGYLEVVGNCHFAFFQGACGNLVTRSRIPGKSTVSDMEDYGRRLGNEALSLLENMSEVELAPLQFVRRQYACPVDHSTDCKADEARELWNHWMSGVDMDESRRLAKEKGYNSPYQARAVLERLAKPPVQPLELNTVRMGDLAFATAPCEMFDTCGAYVKDNSPFPATLMLAYCNGAYGYFPTRKAFEYGCYEVDTRKYEEGSAEQMAENLVEMLNEMKD